MKTLTKITATALAASLALGVAVPASAASWNDSNRHEAREIRQELSRLDRQLDRGYFKRSLSRAEKQRLERNLDQLQTLYARYARGGFSNAEIHVLDTRLRILSNQFARQAADHNRRRW